MVNAIQRDKKFFNEIFRLDDCTIVALHLTKMFP